MDRLLRRLILLSCVLLNMVVSIPMPLADRSRQLHYLRCIIPILMFLVTFVTPLQSAQCSLMQRLDPTFHGFQFRGADFFARIRHQRYLFWLNTGELPETLEEIAEYVSRGLTRVNRRGLIRQRRRRCVLNNVNQVLLTIMWLRKYPCLDTLALIFDISPSTVCATIHRVIPILWRYFHNQVVWPTIAEWNALRRNWREFPNAVGCIDGTPHEIYRPEAEPQWQFYSGHRHYHLMNTQLIIYNLGNIVYLQAVFLGSINDAGNFNLMERVGPGTNYDMPGDVFLLADKGYADRPPLVTPFRTTQIRRMARADQRRARIFNQKLSKCRIIVEHTFKHVKTYRAISTIWRHPRWFQPIVVELCTFLAQRHVVLFEQI